MDESLLARPTVTLLDDIAARTPAPGGGACAALAVALAAALVEMAARFSDGAPSYVERAAALRDRAASLPDRDAAAYAGFLQARRDRRDGLADDADVAAAAEGAAAVPLEILEAAAEAASLAAAVAREGNPRLRGDATTGLHLARAAAESAYVLVCADVDDAHPLVTRARATLEAARQTTRVDKGT